MIARMEFRAGIGLAVTLLALALLAWVSESDDSTEVYVWDGTEAVNVSDNPGEEFRASWSWGGAD